MPTLPANPTPTSMWWSVDKAVNSSSKYGRGLKRQVFSTLKQEHMTKGENPNKKS